MSVLISDIYSVGALDNWVEFGCRYAQLSLTRTYNRMGTDPCHRMSSITVGMIAQCALVKLLKDMGLDFDTQGNTPWYEIDRYDMRIGRYECDVKSLMVQREVSDVEQVLDWCVLVPADQLRSSFSNKEEKIYIFGYVCGRKGSEDTARWLVHVPSDECFWKRQEPLGKVTLYVEAAGQHVKDVNVVVGGTTSKDEKSRVLEQEITLAPGQKAATQELYELLYIRCLSLTRPSYKLILDSKCKRIVVSARDWCDIWIYDSRVLLVGWAWLSDIISWNHLPTGSRCDPVPRTRTLNFANRVRNLKSLSELQKNAFKWKHARGS